MNLLIQISFSIFLSDFLTLYKVSQYSYLDHYIDWFWDIEKLNFQNLNLKSSLFSIICVVIWRIVQANLVTLSWFVCMVFFAAFNSVSVISLHFMGKLPALWFGGGSIFCTETLIEAKLHCHVIHTWISQTTEQVWMYKQLTIIVNFRCGRITSTWRKPSWHLTES